MFGQCFFIAETPSRPRGVAFSIELRCADCEKILHKDTATSSQWWKQFRVPGTGRCKICCAAFEKVYWKTVEADWYKWKALVPWRRARKNRRARRLVRRARGSDDSDESADTTKDPTSPRSGGNAGQQDDEPEETSPEEYEKIVHTAVQDWLFTPDGAGVWQ